MGFQQGFRINTNTASLDTYRAYSKSQAGLERNIERLSSGLRINSAKDDAAGLAISERMNNQVRGMQQANRNVQQGNNLLQTTEGAMNEISNILGRMRELAVQSASDTVTSDDRSSIDLEFEQLKSEIDRITESTEYNGMKLLNGERAKSVNIPAVSDLITTGSSAEITNITVSSSVQTGTRFLLGGGSEYMQLQSMETGYVQAVYAETGNFSEGDVLNFDKHGITLELGSNFSNIQGLGPPPNNYFSSFPDGESFIVENNNFISIQIGSNNDADHPSSLASESVLNGGTTNTWPAPEAHSIAENRLTFNIGDISSKGLGNKR